MSKKLTIAIAAVVLILLAVLGVVIWQKSTTQTPAPAPTSNTPKIRKVDLASQPDWVQKLKVTAVKGRSANGLTNVTIKAEGFPEGLVESLIYTIQYETTNKGTQGAFSTRPIEIRGETEFSKTIDFGTCSTKSCVRHDGVTSVELELDFLTKDGDEPIWTGTLDLK